MKKCKRGLSVVLVVSMIASLAAGCGSSKTTETAAKETKAAETTAESKAEGTATAETGVTSDGNGWQLWDSEGNMNREGRDAQGTNAVVSSGKYEASQAGIEVLQKGGNAVDAAVAVGFALGVCEPSASGIGGGGFMTIRSESGDTVFLDFRERAPGQATPELWVVGEDGKVKDNENLTGGKSVGIPGEVAGLCYALEKYGSGKLTLADIMQPAITLAEEGYYVSPTLAADMSSTYNSMIKFPELGEIFLNADGLNYQVGDLFKNPDLAETYKKIAAGGKDAFYTGEMAQAIVDSANKYGGVFTLDDLANYEVNVMEPVKGTYRGYEIISSPLPSSGGTHVVEALNIMENFDIKNMEFGSTDNIHVLSEVFKMIYNDRALYMGDPNYVEVPSTGLVDKDYAKALADQIDMSAIKTYEEVSPWTYEHEDTTHFSVADAKGNMVAVTQTVNYYFGSCVAVDGYGFPLNDEMGDFTPGSDSPNAIAPGKTPLSSMSPTIVLKEDGSPCMVLGSPGGVRIIAAVTQVISNVIDHGMTMQEAINAPRIYNNATSTLNYEDRFDTTAIEGLTSMGAEVEKADEYYRTMGSVNAVYYNEDGTLDGGADPRRDGKAVAY